ncbi:MAG: hypothetical protein H7337_06355 [Rhizobacter sp.]|nr:hypothetical protein [Rhizobacter sp.]
MIVALREILFREPAGDASIPGLIFTFAWAFNLPDDTASMVRYASLVRLPH